MELSQLRTLIHVAELGSLSKAAERLHVAQPALSRQIRLLEEELAVRLFERHGRGMVVTEQGQAVLAHALKVMAELEEIRATSQEKDGPLRGHVSIGMPPTAIDLLSEPLVAAFREHHPEATVRLVSAYSGHLLDWLQRGEIDISILYDPKSAKTLRNIALLEETLFLIGPSDSGLSMEVPVDFAQVLDRPLLLPSLGHGLRSIVDKYALETGRTAHVPIEADSYTTLKHLVEKGHGYTILPLPPIYQDLVAGTLRAAPLQNPTPRRQLILSHPTDRPTSKLARFAAKVIIDNATQLVEMGLWSGRLPPSAEG